MFKTPEIIGDFPKLHINHRLNGLNRLNDLIGFTSLLKKSPALSRTGL
jgi:hypothetical protein